MREFPRFLGHVACALVLAFSTASAQSEAFLNGRAAARMELTKGSVELAAWCDAQKMSRESYRLYTRVLELDPDNAAARKALGFRRDDSGAWKGSLSREPKNESEKALAEVTAKRAALATRYRDALLELVDGATGDATQRKSVYDELLALDPDDPRVHEELGEAKVDDAWVLKETAATRAQRETIKQHAKTSLAEAPKGASSTASADELRLARWRIVLATGNVRVLSTVENDEAQRVPQATEAAGALLQRVLGAPAGYPDGYTIYLLAPGEKAQFIARHPGLSDEQRAYMQTTAGGGVPNTSNVVVWESDPRVRVDMVVRNTYGYLLRSAYGIGPAQGFAYEGLGIYLTHALLGTRLTFWTVLTAVKQDDFFGGDKLTQDTDAQAQRARLMGSGTNWLSEAHKLYEASKPPRLTRVMKREVNAMETSDMLVAHALTAYLLEGLPPQRANEFFAAIRAGGGGEAVAQALGSTLPELESRLRRWLREQR